jgi:hypothetical protein
MENNVFLLLKTLKAISYANKLCLNNKDSAWLKGVLSFTQHLVSKCQLQDLETFICLMIFALDVLNIFITELLLTLISSNNRENISLLS